MSLQEKVQARNTEEAQAMMAAAEKGDLAALIESHRTLLDERLKLTAAMDVMISMAATDGGAGERMQTRETVAAFERITHELLTLLRELIGIAGRDKGKA